MTDPVFHKHFPLCRISNFSLLTIESDSLVLLKCLKQFCLSIKCYLEE